MKKTAITLLLSILIISISYTVNAQFSKSSKIISAGISLGIYGKYYNDFSEINLNRTFTPPISLQIEKGISEESGLGELSQYITAGVFVGFHAQNFSKDILSTTTYEVHKNYIYIWGGLVGSFHGVPLINEHTTLNLDVNKWDLYVSVKSGIVLERYSSNYDSDPTDIDVQLGAIEITNTNTFFYIGPVVGARYYFTDKFGFFLEIGRSNLSNMTAGVSMKL